MYQQFILTALKQSSESIESHPSGSQEETPRKKKKGKKIPAVPGVVTSFAIVV